MKQIISIIALAAITTLSAQAQVNQAASYITVAYGTPTSGGNNASFLNYIQLPLSDTFGATVDTMTLNPYARATQATILINDSADVYVRNVSGCYYGDALDLYVTTPTTCAGVLYLSGITVNTGTNRIALTENKHCLIRLYYDGTEWVEYGSILNY